MEFNIIFDTTQFHYQKEGKFERFVSDGLISLLDFCSKPSLIGNINFLVPEIVISESVQNRLKQIKEIQDRIHSEIEKLNDFSIVFKTNYESYKYKQKLKKYAYLFIRTKKLKIILPSSHRKQIFIKRAISHVPPFKSDCGFKDTLIWLSVLEYATKKGNKKNFIFITNDNIYHENKEVLTKEFFNQSKGKIEFFRNSFDCQIFLEKEFKLDLDLEKKKSQVELFIQEHIGEIRWYIYTNYSPPYIYDDIIWKKISFIGGPWIVDIKEKLPDIYEVRFKISCQVEFVESREIEKTNYVPTASFWLPKAYKSIIQPSSSSPGFYSDFNSFSDILNKNQELSFELSVNCNLSFDILEINSLKQNSKENLYFASGRGYM